MTEPEQITYKNFWLEQALAEEDDPAPAPPLEGERRCDVAIVGGGYTGLWTALELKRREPSLDVVVIEKEICGYGGSGRNAGHLLNMWGKFPTMRRLFGVERALAVGRAAADALEEVIAFCDTHGIDAEFRRAGWLWGATLPTTVGEWRPIMDALALHQITPLREIAGEEITDRWGVTGLLCGALDERSGHLQPAKLVRGLRRVALEQGVAIHEGTPMTALGRTAPPTVTTPRARLTADRVVLGIYRLGRAVTGAAA